MPAKLEDDSIEASTSTGLPFPLVTKSHILNCSFHSWHPRYRTITPKARLISLPPPFLEYLRADGIVLPDDQDEPGDRSIDDDSGVFSSSDNVDEQSEGDEDVAEQWRATHDSVRDVIAELGGNVVPKLNWSAPKDATWMNANSMECRKPSDVYLLLKSSDFITHDLEHAFDDCVDTSGSTIEQADIPFHLVLRKHVQFNPSVEFRCFVRGRRILGICQRDLNHFEFLFQMQDRLRSIIQEFFDVRLRDTFPDANFVFDVYVPAPHNKVWLVDINPWAPRTDPLLFSWMELLTMSEPPLIEEDTSGEFLQLKISDHKIDVTGQDGNATTLSEIDANYSRTPNLVQDEDDEDDVSSVDEEIWFPELRLIRKSDPEAYSFSTPQYSAHKLPKDVVDAGQSGEGLREFAQQWREILAKRQKEEEELGESSEED